MSLLASAVSAQALPSNHGNPHGHCCDLVGFGPGKLEYLTLFKLGEGAPAFAALELSPAFAALETD